MAKNAYQLGQAKMTNTRMRGPMRMIEKPKDMKGALRMLIQYLRKFIVPLCAALACAVVSVILTLFAPDGMNRITSLIEEGMDAGALDTRQVLAISAAVLLFYLLSSGLAFIQGISLASTTQSVMRHMRNDISRKLNRIPLSRFDHSSFGDLLSRVTNDVDTIGMSLSHGVVDVVTAAATFIGVAIMMLLTNLWLALIALGSSLAGFYLMNRLIHRSQRYFSNRQRYLGELNGHIEEMYAGHLIVKAFSGESDSRREFNRLNQLLYDSNWRSQFLSGIMRPIMDFLGNFGYVAVCVVGAVMAMNGSIGFGVIVAFILYVKMFTQPLGLVAQSATSLQSAIAAAERVFAFLDESEMEDESRKQPLLGSAKGAVEFRQVSFGYTPERTVIQNFSAQIRPGQKVAIVGPTGAGKTTLVNLLMRFYELSGGSILLDGVSIRDTTREDVHNQFCMVLQDTWLFQGSIMENIVYSKKDVPMARVVEACKAVGLHRFIQSLPEGYDTTLSDSTSLSAGQRQLITIARAMIDDAPLLILDEATSSVDTRTEQVVQNAMDRLTKDRTSFTIAHRLSTIRNADMILVMKDGDIVETGAHAQLLEKGGFYSDLWTSQFVNAETI